MAPAPISVRAAPPERGWVAGSVELEPDELRGDDVRYFALWIGEPPVVVADTGVGPFLQSAVEALIANGRAAAAGPAGATTKSVAIVAADRLTHAARAHYRADGPGAPRRRQPRARARRRAMALWCAGVEVTSIGRRSGACGRAARPTRECQCRRSGHRAAALSAAGAADRRRGHARSHGHGPVDRVPVPGYVIVASPIDPAVTTWPLRAAFVPWIGDVLDQRLAGSGSLGGRGADVLDVAPGATVRRPAGAEELEAPDGTVRVLSGATIDAPLEPGVYFLRRGGTRVGAVVVNPEPAESDLTRVAVRSLPRHFKARAVYVDSDPGQWVTAVFDADAQRSLAAFFLALGLALLLTESVLTRRRPGSASGAASMRRAA